MLNLSAFLSVLFTFLSVYSSSVHDSNVSLGRRAKLTTATQ